jgi:endonuclease/exonuclease/phosphatase (EEP) superfamily protein YafD
MSVAPALPRQGARHVLRFLVAAGFMLVLAVGTVPDLLGLDRRSPFIQLVSFRPVVLAGGLVLLVLLAVLLRLDRRVWPFVAGTLVVLLVGAGMTLPRAFAEPLPTGGTPLKVLAFNTFEGQADVAALAQLIRTGRPDLISLPESGSRFAAELAAMIEPMGYRLHPTTGVGHNDVNNVTAAVSDRLGNVHVRIGRDTSTFPYVDVTGGALGPLHFIAFHSVAPVPGSVRGWLADMALLQKWCAGTTPAIVAGDFNATLDNSPLRDGTAGCGDAAAERGDGLTPTWGPYLAGPGARSVIGPQIDHVFATRGITAEEFGAHDIPGSDHRAVTSTLLIPG